MDSCQENARGRRDAQAGAGAGAEEQQKPADTIKYLLFIIKILDILYKIMNKSIYKVYRLCNTAVSRSNIAQRGDLDVLTVVQ